MRILFVDPAALMGEAGLNLTAANHIARLASAGHADIAILAGDGPAKWAAIAPFLHYMTCESEEWTALRDVVPLEQGENRVVQIGRWLAANPSCSHWGTVGLSDTFEVREDGTVNPFGFFYMPKDDKAENFAGVTQEGVSELLALQKKCRGLDGKLYLGV